MAVETDPAISRIFESLFRVDIWEEYKILLKAMKIGEKHSDYGTLMDALDKAEDNSRRAHRLLMNAKLQREKYNASAAPIEAGMRKEATKALQREKVDGVRNKAITDADVMSYCAVMFADEWQEISATRARHKFAEEHVEHLVECWKSRCRTLQTMVGKLR